MTMRKTYLCGVLAGVILTLIVWMMGDAPGHLFFSGLFLALISYLLFVVTLYVKKSDVLSRGGWISFRQKPWSYRVYFLIILFPWFILTMLILSELMEYLVV